MAETNTVVENYKKNFGLTESEKAGLLAYKKSLGESLAQSPDILKGRDVDDVMHIDDADPLDLAFLYVLDHYVFDESKKDQLHGQEDLRKGFEALPKDIHDIIDAKHALFDKVKGFSNEQNTQQAATLEIADKSLGFEYREPSFDDDDRLVIDAATSRALRNYLEDVKQSGVLKTDFEPRIFDNKAQNALDELVRLRQIEAGVRPGDVNDFMVHLFSMEQNNNGLLNGASGEDKQQIEVLGKAVAMRNLLDLIVTGKTPSGAHGSKANAEINWDKPWTNHNSGDMFFSKNVYKAIFEEKYGTGDDVHLTTDVLFNKSGYSEDSYEILIEAAKKAGIDPDDPNRVVSEMAVGKIAIEIIKVRAEQVWCIDHPNEKFDPKQIHAMIHNKEFMPHLKDLEFVDKGFGLPDAIVTEENGDISNLREMADQMGPDSWRLGVDYPRIVQQHRVAAFQETFGSIPQDALDEKARLYKPDFIDHMGQVQEGALHRHVQVVAGTPAMYYAPPPTILGYTRPTQYELGRQEYLDRVQPIIEDDRCDPSSGRKDRVRPDEDKSIVRGSFQKAGEDSRANIIETNKYDCVEGDCVIECELEEKGPGRFLHDDKTTLTEEQATDAQNNLMSP
ncbi:MAG: hypothetical protein KAJ29_02505 [Alphaproteobacteria bacterium]|nr:hypothetical protein [Alphaproteobacteria bacterium]